jgi:hypothetical protein
MIAPALERRTVTLRGCARYGHCVCVLAVIAIVAIAGSVRTSSAFAAVPLTQQATDTDQPAGAQATAENDLGSTQPDASGAAGQTASAQGGGGAGFNPFGITDLGAWLQEHVRDIVSGLFGDLADGLHGALASLLNSMNFVTRTPENLSFANDQVKAFEAGSRTLANALLVVVGAVSGFNVMLRPYFGSTYHGAMELLPRLAVGAILINTASWWCKLAIQVNNAACDVFWNGPPLGPWDLVWHNQPLVQILAVLLYLVVFLLLVLQQLMRLGLVDALIAIAPLAGLLWILPQTVGWARLWSSLFLGTVFAQFVQVLVLSLGFHLVGTLPATSGVIQPLLGIAVLWLAAVRVPALLRGGAAGGNLVAGLLATAGGAAVGAGAGRLVGTAIGAGVRTVGMPARGTAASGAPQQSSPTSVGVGQEHSQQLSLPLSAAHRTTTLP